MKFSKSLILAVAIASCSFYVADAAADTCATFHRKEKVATAPVAPNDASDAITKCGDCFDTHFKDSGASIANSCSARTAHPTCPPTKYAKKDADKCEDRNKSKTCPANSQPNPVDDDCLCNSGYHDNGQTGTGFACSQTKTDAVCKATDANSKRQDDDNCVCENGHKLNAATPPKCERIELKDLDQAQCALLNRAYDASKPANKCGDCMTNFVTDSGAPYLQCFPKSVQTNCEANKATTFREFANDMCKCQSKKAPATSLEYSSDTAKCVDGNGSVAAAILSSSVVIVSVLGSLAYLL